MRVAFLMLIAGSTLGALGSAPARAVVCALDAVPAATLLLPYFELDARDLAKKKPKREAPLVAITNLGAAATLARVTLWTDLSVPTLAFDVPLTGYDVEEVDLWKVFRGELPGLRAMACNNGGIPTQQLSEPEIDDLRLAHSGAPVPSAGGLCAALSHGDTLLRGYLTVDASFGCTPPNDAVYPSDPGYFGIGGIASNENVLGGQYFVQSRKRKVAESARLVAIEADTSSFGPGDATFYGRYVSFSGADAREPLPVSWGLRTLSDPAAKRSTELLVWRSAETVQAPFQCENLGQAGWYPLAQNDIVAFDDFENAEGITGTPLPAEANRVLIGGEALPISAPSGWLFLALGLPGSEIQSFVGARNRQGPPSARGLVDAVVFDSEICRTAPAAGTPIP